MTKQKLIENNFKHIATKNDKTELWVKYTEVEDMIRYALYFPSVDVTGEDRIVSYHSIIEPYAIMKDYFAKEMENIKTWKKIE